MHLFHDAGRRALCPLATALDWAALIRILICAWDSAHPQPSPLSELLAKIGDFPAHISTGTGLFSSRICAATGLTPVSTLRWDGTRSLQHLRHDLTLP